MLAQMDQAATADWKRLGTALTQRRVEIDPRYMNRSLFCAERGLNYRLTYDIEAGARTNYGAITLRAIEVAYELEVGAIDVFLASDGELRVRAEPIATPSLTVQEQAAARAFKRRVIRDSTDNGERKRA